MQKMRQVCGEQDQTQLSEKSLMAAVGDFSFASSWGTQFRVLLGRSWKQTSRDKFPLFLAAFQVPCRKRASNKRLAIVCNITFLDNLMIDDP